MRWQTALTMALTSCVAFTTFEGLKATATGSLGAPGAIMVSAAGAVVAGWLAGALVSRLLKAPG
jgi:hypothetical protein